MDKFKLEVYDRLYNKDILDKKPFYNIGAGRNFYHPYWINVDYDSEWYKNEISKNIINHNLMSIEPIPIEKDSVEIIYTSHTIEHISEKAVFKLFKESYRFLKKNGLIRITCPDANLNYYALLRNDIGYFYWDNWYETYEKYSPIYNAPANSVPLEERWLHTLATQLCPIDKSPSKKKFSSEEIKKIILTKTKEEIFDYFTSFCEFNPEIPRNHISWWNHDKIKRFLKEAGFKIIYRSGYKQSSNPVLRNMELFDNTHPAMSLYIEAIK